MSKSYVVIGASKGIGEALTQKLEADDHHVIGVSRTPANSSSWLQSDVTTDEGIDAIVSHLAGKKIDALLYMAGAWEENAFTDDYDFLQSPRSETKSIIALNMVAPILLVQALIENLSQANNPKIILMGSTSGLDNTRPKEVAYTASKFGLRGVSQSLSQVLKPHNIHTTIINPGDVATPEVIEDCRNNGSSTSGLIPLADLINTIDWVLQSPTEALPTEINVFDKR